MYPLKSVKLTPELNKALAGLFVTNSNGSDCRGDSKMYNMPLRTLRKGQESDRLAIAYSCQQKLLQAREISDPNIRKQ